MDFELMPPIRNRLKVDYVITSTHVCVCICVFAKQQGHWRGG